MSTSLDDYEEAMEHYSPSFDNFNSKNFDNEKQKCFIVELLAKLHIEHFTNEVLREIKLHLQYTTSFNKTLVYCLDRVLRQNGRYIPLARLCYLNNLSIKEYKLFLKNHAERFVNGLPNLHINSYARYVCNELHLDYKSECLVLAKASALQLTHPSLHPLAIVCAIINFHFPKIKISQLADISFIAAQSIRHVSKATLSV